jgi:inner membrane protein
VFIGHLPSGYLLAAAVARGRPTRTALAAALAGAVFPDVDLLWFYLGDDRQTLHHKYFPHLPAFWLVVALAWLACHVLSPPAALRSAGWRFIGGAFLHLCPDSIVGRVYWLAPFSAQPFYLFTVHAVPGRFWVWNFVPHPSFDLEILVCAAAVTAARPWRTF